MTKNFSCFSSRLLLPIFQPSRPLSGNALKKKKAFRSPPAHVPPCRQMMRTRSGSSGRSGGQLPKHAGLPASGSFQLRTKPLRMSSSSSAASNSLKPEHSPPRRHNARTPEKCPCVARWDVVVTASCEAFCEKTGIMVMMKMESQPQPAVKPSVSQNGDRSVLTAKKSQPQLAVKPSASAQLGQCLNLLGHNHSQL